jgi:hypothetical protein
MKLTREGKRFLLATILLTFAAFNTGNNLIYMILAMMFSIVIISAAALIINMKGLSLAVSVLRGRPLTWRFRRKIKRGFYPRIPSV